MMDNGIYLVTAIITILWSVRLFMVWHEKGSLKEESILRYITIFTPVVWFLVIIFVALGQLQAVKLDIIGLVVLDVFNLLAIIASFVVFEGFKKKRERQKKFFIAVLWIYNILVLVWVAFLLILRLNPVYLIRITNLFYQATNIDILGFSWIGTTAESKEQDFVSMLNKILIALLSYIPVSLVRFFAIRYQRIQTKKMLDKLTERVDTIETRLRSIELSDQSSESTL